MAGNKFHFIFLILSILISGALAQGDGSCPVGQQLKSGICMDESLVKVINHCASGNVVNGECSPNCVDPEAPQRNINGTLSCGPCKEGTIFFSKGCWDPKLLAKMCKDKDSEIFYPYSGNSGKCYPRSIANISGAPPWPNDPVDFCQGPALDGKFASEILNQVIGVPEGSDYKEKLAAYRQKMKKCQLQISDLLTPYTNPTAAQIDHDITLTRQGALQRQVDSNLKNGNPHVDDMISDWKEVSATLGDPTINSHLAEWKQEKNRFLKKNKADCFPEVDLRKRLGTIRNQDGEGLCFAFAIANIVSYQTKKRISATDLSITYQMSKNEGFGVPANGGNPFNTLTEGAKKGFCLNSKFADEDTGYDDLKKDLTALENFNTVSKDKLDQFCDVQTGVSKLFPTKNINDLLKVVRHEQKDRAMQVIDSVCSPRTHLPADIKPQHLEFSLSSGTPNDDSQKYQELNAALTNQTPLAITMENFVGNQSHAMTLAGRRWNKDKNQCEYIIRNSWGNDCLNGQVPSEYTCEKGDLFISREDMPLYLEDAVYLKKDSK